MHHVSQFGINMTEMSNWDRDLVTQKSKNISLVPLLLNQTWVLAPVHTAAHSKASLLTWGCSEGEFSVYCKVPDKESGAANAQKP